MLTTDFSLRAMAATSTSSSAAAAAKPVGSSARDDSACKRDAQAQQRPAPTHSARRTKPQADHASTNPFALAAVLPSEQHIRRERAWTAGRAAIRSRFRYESHASFSRFGRALDRTS